MEISRGGKCLNSAAGQWGVSMRRFWALLVALALLPLAAAAAPFPDETEWSHASDTLTVGVTRVQKPVGKEQLTYYIADIRIQDPAQLKTAFAKDTYDVSHGEIAQSIAERNGAVIAINADHCNHPSNRKSGIIIRNGAAYRDRSTSRDLMYIDARGDMHVVLRDERKERELSAETLLEQGAVQTFEFGPALILDGEALTLPGKYFIVTSNYSRDPRTVIGQIGPLHYMLLVADGRRKGWSDKGMKFDEMQEVLLEHGCRTAYNLDGGGTSTLFFEDRVLNRTAWGNQRLVSEIIYFTD